MVSIHVVQTIYIKNNFMTLLNNFMVLTKMKFNDDKHLVNINNLISTYYTLQF